MLELQAKIFIRKSISLPFSVAVRGSIYTKIAMVIHLQHHDTRFAIFIGAINARLYLSDSCISLSKIYNQFKKFLS